MRPDDNHSEPSSRRISWTRQWRLAGCLYTLIAFSTVNDDRKFEINISAKLQKSLFMIQFTETPEVNFAHSYHVLTYIALCQAMAHGGAPIGLPIRDPV